ncbi:hypothetical protein CHUAL_009789 [Chamberlinius hualienensis]
MLCFKYFHVITQMAMVVYLWIKIKTCTPDMIRVMFLLVYWVLVYQLVVSRFVVINNREKFVNLINETNKMFNELTKCIKQPLFKSFRVFIRMTLVYPVYCVMQYILNLMNLLQRARMEESDHQEMRDWPRLFSFVYMIAIPFNYVWLGTVEILMVSQLFALYNIFCRLESCHFIDKHQSHLEQLKNFIRIHRKACRLVKLTNETMGRLTLLWSLFHTMFALFHTSSYFIIKTESSIVILTVSVSAMSAETIISGMINKMVCKSLAKCLKNVYLNFPLNKATRISAKIELYCMHVNVSKLGLTLENLTTFRTSSVLNMINFILTYALFLHKNS